MHLNHKSIKIITITTIHLISTILLQACFLFFALAGALVFLLRGFQAIQHRHSQNSLIGYLLLLSSECIVTFLLGLLETPGKCTTIEPGNRLGFEEFFGGWGLGLDWRGRGLVGGGDAQGGVDVFGIG
jgi:hypothetical protein